MFYEKIAIVEKNSAINYRKDERRMAMGALVSIGLGLSVLNIISGARAIRRGRR